MTSKSGNESVGLTGPVVSQGGTAGHLPVGYALREFLVERVLGEGGFSVVYLATDTRLERQVAIKEYMPTALATRNPDLSINVRSSSQHREAFDAGLRSFINEAKLLARFEHRALVKVHQFWQEKGTAYMVMPFYSGPTLKAWAKQHTDPIDPMWLEQFLRLLMDALETLHKENCLHRDVAPDNILVLNERAPLLLDFGAARRVIGDITQALTVILKPGFAPIEQYAESQSMRQGPWTDVYALCAVAHFMITGRAPTPSVTRVLADDLVPLRAAAEGRFPEAFLAAVDAGLTVRPQQRPQTIAALRDLMNGAAVADQTLTASPGAHASPPPQRVPTTGQPLPRMLEPEAADADKTRIVTAPELPLRTGADTISSPVKPAMAPPIEAATTPELTGDPLFGSRLPSRSMREHDAAISGLRTGGESDRESRLPLILGAVAIAAVIAGAWFLIDWLNNDIAQSRRYEPAYSPAPTPSPAPAPASPRSSPSSEIAAPANVAAAIPPPAEPAPAPAPVAAAAEQKDAPAPTQPASATNAEALNLEKTMAPTTLQPEAEPAPAPTTKPTTSTPVATKPAAPTQSAAASPSAATKKLSPVAEAEIRHMNDLLADASKSGAPVPTETADIRSPSIPPTSASHAEETQVAPSVSAPSVATVQTQAAIQIAAVEPSRVAAPPSPSPTAALSVVSNPEPMFPREASESVDKGQVTARLFISPDGTVNKVEILSAQPPRVFDREVRDTALRWRYEPPGQPRQADVEFVFDRFKER